MGVEMGIGRIASVLWVNLYEIKKHLFYRLEDADRVDSWRWDDCAVLEVWEGLE